MAPVRMEQLPNTINSVYHVKRRLQCCLVYNVYPGGLALESVWTEIK
jgi:hypothetical protein